MAESMIERIGAAIEQAPEVSMRVNKIRDDGLIYEIIVVDLPLDVDEEITVLQAVGNSDEADDAQSRWRGIITARAAVEAMREPPYDVIEAGRANNFGRYPNAAWETMIDAILSESPTPGDSR